MQNMIIETCKYFPFHLDLISFQFWSIQLNLRTLNLSSFSADLNASWTFSCSLLVVWSDSFWFERPLRHECKRFVNLEQFNAKDEDKKHANISCFIWIWCHFSSSVVFCADLCAPVTHCLVTEFWLLIIICPVLNYMLFSQSVL